MILKKEKKDNEIIEESLSYRMKRYEKESQFILDNSKPIIIRLDGNSFSKFTKKYNFKKPFDERITKAMESATKAVMDYCSNVSLGYCQSDEITIILNPHEGNRDHSFLSGRLDKICSLLASRCSNAFNKSLREQGCDTYADFDCRAFNVPEDEAMKALLWRQYDCWKNFIGIVAHTMLNQSMDGVSTKEKILLLEKSGILTDQFDRKYHYGTLLYEKKTTLPMPEEYKKYKSNKGVDTVTRKSIETLYGLISDNKELFNKLIKKGFST